MRKSLATSTASARPKDSWVAGASPRCDLCASVFIAFSKGTSVSMNQGEDGVRRQLELWGLQVELAAERVPKSKKLMKITVFTGDEERTIVAGIAAKRGAGRADDRDRGQPGARETDGRRIERHAPGRINRWRTVVAQRRRRRSGGNEGKVGRREGRKNRPASRSARFTAVVLQAHGRTAVSPAIHSSQR